MRDPFARVCFAAKSFLFAITIAASISSALAAQPNVKADEVPNIAPGSAYIQTNLASDVNGLAQTLDPQLINPWGIAIRGTSPFWTANNAASSSSLLRVDPVTDATIINPSPSHISIPDGLPTGVVGNTTSDFQITPPGGGTPAAAIFIFDSITGNLTAWNGASGASAQSVVSMPGHVWTGLAIGANGGGNRLYAADFANNHIDVFDGTYTATTVTGGFIDATIPAGYAPFNIQNLGGSLFVTYAKVGGDGEAENGIGNGFVRKFNTDGVRDLTFAINNGALDAPWGVAIAPASFGIFGGALIVGNFSDFGTIHAYNPSTGAFLGTLQDPGGDPIVIDELWGLQFGNDGNGGDVDAMYFTAGIAEESHGLFGVLRPTTAASTTLIRFTSDQYSVFEPQGSINITVFREGDTSGSATVNYAPLTGSGTGFASGSDFTLAPGTLTFAPGETVKILTVTVANDGGGEGDETLDLVLSNPTNAQLATPGTATLTISDSAPVPNIAPGSAYIQTNLASDVNGIAQTLDPQLINPWGIAIRGTSPFWTANNAASSSSLLRVDPVTDATIINPSPSHISIPGGLPTGVVGNTTSDFQITPPGGGTPAAATFIFDSITGNLTAWNGASGASAQNVVSMPGHVWTGLAIGANGGGNRLYAADFANNHIDVFDGTYTATTVTGGFIDATIPAGYAPFNIQNLGGSLFVTYAKVGGDGEAENGIGNGFVRKFNTDGVRDLTFAINNGALDAPWGVAIAPASFGIFGGALIVGNFSDFGTIHAYNPSTGAFLGTLQDPGGDPIVIDELWGLQFGNDGNGGDVDAMYFTAGIAEESHGLFGVLRPTAAASTTLIRFLTESISAAETQGSVNVTVIREGDTTGSATVHYAAVTGSGAGFADSSDFTLAPNTLTFAPGETFKTFSVGITNDTLLTEGNETLELVLSNPTNAQLATPSIATLTILDNGTGIANLSITKTAVNRVLPGSSFDYTITVANAGPDAATNVIVTDNLPPSLTLVSATPSQGSCSGTTTITCTLGTINSGANATITLTVNAPAVDANVSNTATVSSDQSDPSTANNAATAIVQVGVGVPVPTLSELMLLLVAMLLAIAGAMRLMNS